MITLIKAIHSDNAGTKSSSVGTQQTASSQSSATEVGTNSGDRTQEESPKEEKAESPIPSETPTKRKSTSRKAKAEVENGADVQEAKTDKPDETAAEESTAAPANKVVEKDIKEDKGDAAEAEGGSKANTGVTLQDVRALLAKKATTIAAKTQFKAELTKYGFANVSQIPEDQYGHFMNFLNELD